MNFDNIMTQLLCSSICSSSIWVLKIFVLNEGVFPHRHPSVAVPLISKEKVDDVHHHLTPLSICTLEAEQRKKTQEQNNTKNDTKRTRFNELPVFQIEGKKDTHKQTTFYSYTSFSRFPFFLHSKINFPSPTGIKSITIGPSVWPSSSSLR